MAFRFLEAFIPGPDTADLEAALKEHHVLGLWHSSVDENLLLVRVLLDVGKTEAILGLFDARYAGHPSYRLVLLPVEATVPVVGEAKAVEDTVDDPATRPTSRVSIAEVLNEVNDMLSTGRIFFTLAVLSTIVAAVGLYTDNVAVIIGAMVIAPLLGPNVALSLATTLANPKLAAKAGRGAALGFSVVLIMSITIGYAHPPNPATPEIANRTHVGFQDLALALASGVAGTLSITTGVSSALVGVMVAVALLPPLVTVGLLVGAGEFTLAYGALLLVLVNLFSINLAGVATFLAQGIRPRLFWDQAKARRATFMAIAVWTVLLAILTYLLVLTGATRSG